MQNEKNEPITSLELDDNKLRNVDLCVNWTGTMKLINKKCREIFISLFVLF